jgi:hypothetical protein
MGPEIMAERWRGGCFVAVKQEIGCLSVTFCSIDLLLAGILLSDGCQSGHLPFKLKVESRYHKIVMIRREAFLLFTAHWCIASGVIIECDNGAADATHSAATKQTTCHLNNNRPKNFLLIIINKNRMQIDEQGVWCFDGVPCWCVQTHFAARLSSI